MVAHPPEFDETSRNNKETHPLRDEYAAEMGPRAVAGKAAVAAAAPSAAPSDRTPTPPGKGLPEAVPPQDTVPVPIVNEGKFTVKNEAEIVTSKDGKVILSRTDGQKTGFQLIKTKDGGVKYEHHGPNLTDNYAYTITPDGKGGNNIQWQINTGKDGKVRLEGNYHWTPKATAPFAPGGPLAPPVPFRTKSGASQGGVADISEPSRSTMALQAAVSGRSEQAIMADGQGTRIHRIHDDVANGSGAKVGRTSFTIKTSDNQGSRISIDETGDFTIQNTNNSQLIFQAMGGSGYAITSSVQTEDGVTAQSSVNGSTSIMRDGIMTAQHPDGSSEIGKTDDQGVYTKWSTFKDGTKITERRALDSSTLTWIIPANYPKGGWMQADGRSDATAEPLPNGQIPRMIYMHDNAIARPVAATRSSEIEATQHIKIKDHIESKKYAARPATLLEANTLDVSLQKFPCDPKRELSFVFLDGRSQGTGIERGFYASSDQTITINATAPREKPLQEDTIYATAERLESLYDHELAHDWTYRLDPEKWDSGEQEEELAKIFGMHSITDVTDHEQRWVVEGETIKGEDGNKITFYYKHIKDGPWQRCDLDGNLIDSSGKKVDKDKQIELIDDLDSHARVKLPTKYAYHNPREAAAELLTIHGINEASRIAFMQKTSPAVRQWTEYADQKIINATKPKTAEGWIRLPSGKIVAKTKEAEQQVIAFNNKYTPKGNS
jgi:hypothetical protein